LNAPLSCATRPKVFPTTPIANGPTIVATASLDGVTEWFPQITTDEVRLRLRATLEVSGVPAFWEDQLFGENERSVIRFRIGEVNFEGSNPCARCPVPPRNPHTGEDIVGFQKHFMAQRAATLPSWSPRERFDHFYRLPPTPVSPPLKLASEFRLATL
jgi:uncharacterized protein YcbX